MESNGRNQFDWEDTESGEILRQSWKHFNGYIVWRDLYNLKVCQQCKEKRKQKSTKNAPDESRFRASRHLWVACGEKEKEGDITDILVQEVEKIWENKIYS